MKRTLLFLPFLFLSICAWAQPANDDCAGLIDLGVAPLCPSDIYTNVDATASDIGNDNIPDCFNGGNVDRDVWFQFTTDAVITDYNITVNGVSDAMGSDPILNPQIEIYRGEMCGFDELAALAVCATATNGDNFVNSTVFGLDPNTVYYIRVNDYTASATPNAGSFEFCITEFIPDVNICDGPGSSSCSGTLYDCGGPDMDYGIGENFVYTICPSDFHECILIDIVDFNIDNNSDNLFIFAGDNTGAPLLATLTGASNGTDFQIQANSECITFQFISDGFVTAPGFELDWLCVSFPCSGSSEDSPEEITSIPFNDSDSSCGEGSSIGSSPCVNDGFLNGPDYFYTFDSPGDICASIEITNAEAGTNVLVLDGPPSDPGTNCVAIGQSGLISSASFEDAGTYYIIVANGAGCTDFDINIQIADCSLSPALVDALGNPINGCQQFDENGNSLPTIFNLEIGFQDVPLTGANDGCWIGVGAGNFYWFTMNASADGAFGFIVSGGNFPSDIDYNVWGPFTNDEVNNNPQDVIDFISNNEPIRSSYAGGTEPTGLADINPNTGEVVLDTWECNDPANPNPAGPDNNDDFTTTIQAQEGEVYVMLINDWGGQIVDGVVSVDFGPSDPGVLAGADAVNVLGSDTTICLGQSADLFVESGSNNITWIGETGTLSCTDCPNPTATPMETTTYQVVVDGICINDTVEVNVSVFDLTVEPDFTVCLGEDVQFMAGSEFDNATYSWTGTNLGDLSCTDCPDPILTTSMAGTFTYTVTLTTPECVLMDEVTVTVLPNPAPKFEVAADTVLLCIGESTDLGMNTNQTTDVTYSWTSIPAGFTSASSNPNITPTETTTYYVEVNSVTCPVTSFDSIYVQVNMPPVIDTAPDTLVCQGELVSLGATIPEAGVTYSWMPIGGLDDPTSANPIATIGATTTYTLTATVGACVETASITVTSTVINIEILSPTPDSLTICKGEEVLVNAVASPSGTTVTWTPADGSINPTTGLNVTLSPETATLYFASVNVPGCSQIDSIYVDVDSIPYDMSIMPSDTMVCRGSLVLLQSPTYEPADFMGISHQWQPLDQLISSDTLYNVVLNATDDTDFIRTTVLGACTQMDTATVEILETSEIIVTPSDTTICAGDPVDFLATSPDITEFTWTPDDGTLSCLECPDPTANVSGSGSFTFMVEGEFEGCPVMTSATINVLPALQQSVINDMTLCNPAPVQLNGVTDPNPNTIYMWSSEPNDATLNGDAAQPVVTPTVTTTYMVTIDNGTCDPYQDEVTITIPDDPTLSIEGPAIICEDDDPTFTAILVNGSVSDLSWSTGETGTATIMPGVTESGTITVSYLDICNNALEASIDVTVIDLVVEIDGPERDTLFEGEQIELTVITDPANSDNTYVWNTTPELSDPMISVEASQAAYNVVVTTPEGCEGEETVDFTLIEANPMFANVFTPGEAENNFFTPIGLGLGEIIEFQIFTRWGEMVYDNENPTQGWNGKKGDKDLPADVYFYKAVLRTASMGEFTRQGDITLLR